MNSEWCKFLRLEPFCSHDTHQSYFAVSKKWPKFLILKAFGISTSSCRSVRGKFEHKINNRWQATILSYAIVAGANHKTWTSAGYKKIITDNFWSWHAICLPFIVNFIIGSYNTYTYVPTYILNDLPFYSQ